MESSLRRSKKHKKTRKHRKHRKHRKSKKVGGANSFKKLEDGINQDFNYTTFDKTKSIRRMGENSKNDFLYQVLYKSIDNKKKSYAVLTSSISNNEDSLFYEYRVGLFVNKLTYRYPCFIETYGIVKYNTPEFKNKLQNNKSYDSTSKFDLKKNSSDETNNTLDYAVACTNPTQFAILTQYLEQENIKYIHTMLEVIHTGHPNSIAFRVLLELSNILFQIYIPLAKLKDVFTHNNLNPDNIALYRPFFSDKKGYYIQYNYKFKGGVVVSFKSEYMVKIINYGDSYFSDSFEKINTKTIYENLCGITGCDNNKRCNDKSTLNVNMSKDLFILDKIKDKLKEIQKSKNPKMLGDDITNELKIKGMAIGEMAVETIKNIVAMLSGRINNVEDAARLITNNVKSQLNIDINNALYKDSTKRKITLNIDMYGNEDMTYE